MNEPDYLRLDPEERRNKIMAALAALLGLVSLCASMIPACGGMIAVAGIISGYYGMKSENRKLGILGMVLSFLGLTIAIIYTIILTINKK